MTWDYICFHVIAVCPGCDSNHICTAPNTCVCPTGWTGNDCHTGMQTLHVRVNTAIWFTKLIITAKLTDINECEQNTAGCERDCTNIDGGYSCTCGSGYALATDLHNCLGKLCCNMLSITLGLIQFTAYFFDV